MHEYETLTLEVDSTNVASVYFNQPEKQNALNKEMISDITSVADSLMDQGGIRALIIRGNGDSFCAGGDIEWMRYQMNAKRVEKIRQSATIATFLRKLDQLPFAVIAVVDGPCFGGGIGIISVCDIVLATENAKFVLSETKIGLVSANVSPFIIRRIGEGAARQMFYTGVPFDAERAFHYGLVSKVCAAKNIEKELTELINHILATAPNAVARAKKMCLDLARRNFVDELHLTSNVLADCWESKEIQEGIAALTEGRDPCWSMDQK